ncbi:MAG TPA: NUDIX hydrolase [Burkholderiaceae bacterium]|nr:NUDIX hydrolase [Burkholderiaceae bacterium]
MKKLDETTVSSTVVFSGDFLKIRRDIAALPNGLHARREYVVHPGAAAMVPLAEDGRILVERQYRYSMRRTYYELPAGKLDAGETSLQTAKRELLEETGYVAAEWALLTQIHPAIGFSDELMDIYLARGLTLREARLDEGELLEIEWVTLGWLVDELRAGRLPDVKTQITVFWLEKLYSGEWPWPQFAPA